MPARPAPCVAPRPATLLQKLPRASTLVCPLRALPARARPSAGPPASLHSCSDRSATPEPPEAAQGLLLTERARLTPTSTVG
ncbi:hypothetical protein NDU88_004315 [Pleurodeles waltl]|uniref:Uncharacterized protein n=1 Tax=Pleurodeles waltl TaxID=8319 RepID=A0AAV7WXV7_PLEWA|nr:hypothetical protein NDU88_004315 [Pleurodeles waltl]